MWVVGFGKSVPTRAVSRFTTRKEPPIISKAMTTPIVLPMRILRRPIRSMKKIGIKEAKKLKLDTTALNQMIVWLFLTPADLIMSPV
uniref:Uncharacterized protein n=1 Tax=Panagrellus redivivus TaxID=6233 RepID=A0A7E4UPI4_PANRE